MLEHNAVGPEVCGTSWTRRRWVCGGVTALVVVAAAVGGGLLWRAERGLEAAELLVLRRDWPTARARLQGYLWLHPRDTAAHLALAEAWSRDDALPDAGTERALFHLAQIPDDAVEAYRARVQEAKLLLLLRRRAYSAEASLHRALRIGPDDYEASYLLWKIYELTDRAEFAEPFFWACFEQTDPSLRRERLRDWYLSQFQINSATSAMDQILGFSQPDQSSTKTTRALRLFEFEKSDPDSPIGHAVVARFMLHEGNPKEALKIIDQFSALPGAMDEPSFLAAGIDVLLEAGEFQRAEQFFDAWPAESREGFEFWRSQGLIADEVRRDYAAAASAFAQAETQWPGEFDWYLMNRRANCLARLKRDHEAAEVRARALQLEALSETAVHQQLKVSLAALDQPAALQRVVDYYRNLHRPREAEAWQHELDQLRTNSFNP